MQSFTTSLLAAFLIINQAYCQNPDTTRVEVNHAIRYAEQLYQEATAQNQHLYNGTQYNRYIYNNNSADQGEHQFFESEDWEEGSVVYGERLYPSVPLLYDIVKDQLIIEHGRGHDNVTMQSEQVKSFELLKHKFIRLQENQAGIRTGFYELLYEGRSTVLAKRTKTRYEEIIQSRIHITFPAKSLLYIYKDSVYHSTNSKKAVLAVFADQKKALKKYLRENKDRFGQNREAMLVNLATYYDQLTQP